jgi:hypothetical protein
MKDASSEMATSEKARSGALAANLQHVRGIQTSPSGTSTCASQLTLSGLYPVVTSSPSWLEWRVCGLGLRAEDELVAAGVPVAWELDLGDVDPAYFKEPWEEPDWEDSRR